MEKLSRSLTGLMLAIFALLTGLAILLGTVGNLAHKSYLAALVLSALPLGLWLLLGKRKPAVPSLAERVGAGKTCLALTALCLVLSLAAALPLRLEPEVDAYTYWITALALSRGEPIPNPEFVAMFPHIMGYAAFLAPLLRLFGESLAVPAAANAVLGCLSGLCIFCLLLRWRDLRTAALGCLFWICCPSRLLFCEGVYADAYYTCLLLLFLTLTAYADRVRLPLMLGMGALGGLALRLMNTARPIGVIPMIALGIWILLLRGKKAKEPSGWLRWGAYLALVLAVYLPLGGLWNGYLEDRIGQETASVPGYSICVGFNMDTMGSYSEEDIARLHGIYWDTLSAEQAQQQMLDQAAERVRQADLGRLLPKKLATLLGNDEAGAYYDAPALGDTAYRLACMISNVYYYFLAGLALLGAFRLWKRREQGTFLLAPLYAIGLILSQMLVEVAARYHYSIIPVFVLLAACAGRKTEITSES